jgi:two-component system, NtrC family, sensor kinase
MKSTLMLEDDPHCAEMLRDFLESHSFRVSWVTNGADGVRQILAQDFDVILCDLFMPQLPGDMFYKAVERTKAHLCHRFVFMTGYGAHPRYEAFIRNVKAPVLFKPFLLSDLLNMIDLILIKNCFYAPQNEQCFGLEVRGSVARR